MLRIPMLTGWSRHGLVLLRIKVGGVFAHVAQSAVEIGVDEAWALQQLVCLASMVCRRAGRRSIDGRVSQGQCRCRLRSRHITRRRSSRIRRRGVIHGGAT